MLITFSGLDGAGKSTLIRHLKSELETQQRRVRVLTMYDDIGVYATARRLRDRVRPPRPAPETTASAQASKPPSGLLRVLRSASTKRWVYPADLLLLWARRIQVETARQQVLILDRYFYDSLADVTDGQHWRYVRTFLKLVPRPELPLFIDVPPEIAYARKAEYPLDHLIQRRAKYQQIFKWVPNAVILRNDRLEDTLAALTAAARDRLAS